MSFTVINMPLVRTPMVAPTKIYDRMHLLRAGSRRRRWSARRSSTGRRASRPGLGTAAQLVEGVLPEFNTVFMSENFKMFPESAATDGIREPAAQPTAEAAAFAALMRGIHW